MSDSFSETTFAHICEKASELLGIDPNTLKEAEVPWEIWLKALDEASDAKNRLIRPSQCFLKYSLIKPYDEIPPEYTSISPLISPHLSRAQQIIRERSSPNSKKALEQDLTYWQAWLSAIGFSFLNETINTSHLKAFIIQHIEGIPQPIDQRLVLEGYKQKTGTHKLSTVKRRISSLSIYLDLEKLPNPCKDFEIRKLLERITKKFGGNQKKSKAITKDILLSLLAHCEPTFIGIRDKALLLFGWASGGRRRSEIASALIEHLEPIGNDFIYHIPKSKTDQQGKGHTVPLNGFAATALKNWLAISKIESGPIFRAISKSGNIKGPLSAADINRIIKLRCKKAGYPQENYSAHSLRSGFITEAGRQRCSIGDVMAMSGHKSIQVAMSYYQSGSISHNNAATLI